MIFSNLIANFEHVCVQLHTYADNVALPTSARAAAAIDRYLLPAGPTAANSPHAAAAGEWPGPH